MISIPELLAAHREEIVDRWTDSVKAEAFAEGLSRSELVGVIPEYLSLLGRSIVLESAHLGASQRTLIEHHLSHRLRQGSTLNEILKEFSSLTQCISVALDNDAADGRWSARQASRLFSELNVTCMAVTMIFNEHLLEDEQPEKRFVRLLQKISGDGLSVDNAPAALRVRLGEALALIMRAMAAHTAALLVFDTRTDQLVMSASAGDADEHLEQYVSSLDVATFAGKVASVEGAATAMIDAAVTELEVSETLRNSGIHSLLGIRLSSGHALRGVLYIGVRDRRAFSASEIRRIESLGEVLTVHLDNAQLNAALRAKAQEATAESQLREHFVATLIHDLNAPLMAAKVCAQALLDGRIADADGKVTSIIHHLDHIEEMMAGHGDPRRYAD